MHDFCKFFYTFQHLKFFPKVNIDCISVEGATEPQFCFFLFFFALLCPLSFFKFFIF